VVAAGAQRQSSRCGRRVGDDRRTTTTQDTDNDPEHPDPPRRTGDYRTAIQDVDKDSRLKDKDCTCMDKE